MVNGSEKPCLEFFHSKQLLNGLNKLRQRRELCDVELCVGNSKVSAHRVVLSACSAYFNAMFTGNLLESEKEVINLKGIDEVALHILVEFAYTGKANVSQENVQLLLPAANMLQLNKVKEACCEFLVEQLHPSNCLGIAKFGEAYACPVLAKMAKKYTQDHFQEAVEQEEFSQLQPNQLIELLKDDNLSVVSEQVVFEAVIAWVKYNLTDRSPLLGKLLQFVRLSLLNIRYLTRCFETNELIRSDRASQVLLNEALKFRLLPTKNYNFEMITPRRAPKRIYAVGGKNGLFATLNSVEFYDQEKDRWAEVEPMNLRRFEFGAAVLDSKYHFSFVKLIFVRFRSFFGLKKFVRVIKNWINYRL